MRLSIFPPSRCDGRYNSPFSPRLEIDMYCLSIDAWSVGQTDDAGLATRSVGQSVGRPREQVARPLFFLFLSRRCYQSAADACLCCFFLWPRLLLRMRVRSDTGSEYELPMDEQRTFGRPRCRCPRSMRNICDSICTRSLRPSTKGKMRFQRKSAPKNPIRIRGKTTLPLRTQR